MSDAERLNVKRQGVHSKDIETEALTPKDKDPEKGIPIKASIGRRSILSALVIGFAIQLIVIIVLGIYARRIDNYSTDIVTRLDHLEDKVGFTASSSSDEDYNSDRRIDFDETSGNIGQHYDRSTSVFTCPVKGIYFFTVNIIAAADSSIRFRLIMSKNGRRVTKARSITSEATDSSHPAISGVFRCFKNHKVYVRTQSQFTVDRYSSFSGGMLLSEE